MKFSFGGGGLGPLFLNFLDPPLAHVYYFCTIFSVGNFSLFAVFAFVTRNMLMELQRERTAVMLKPMTRLVSGIPEKIKFLVGSYIPVSVSESSESLLVTDSHGIYGHLEHLMLDILDKRWQTLDLISMMEEFNRSWSEDLNRSGFQMKEWHNLSSLIPTLVSVTDSLSSRPRFKKEDDLTDCE